VLFRSGVVSMECMGRYRNLPKMYGEIMGEICDRRNESDVVSERHMVASSGLEWVVSTQYKKQRKIPTTHWKTRLQWFQAGSTNSSRVGNICIYWSCTMVAKVYSPTGIGVSVFSVVNSGACVTRFGRLISDLLIVTTICQFL
jgi:hypothetical protein